MGELAFMDYLAQSGFAESTKMVPGQLRLGWGLGAGSAGFSRL